MEKAIFYNDKFVEIPSLKFFGSFEKSKSGEWYICWCDSDVENAIGGFRHSGYGRYVLYHFTQNKIVLHGKLERPQSGMVADNGVFSIEDWHFGEELRGTIYVFSSCGQQLIRRTFQANIFNSAISDNGNYVVCQTCNAPASPDENLLTAFDVSRGNILFSITPVTGWADDYIFIEDSQNLGVVKHGIGTYFYDSKGNFINEDEYVLDQLTCNQYPVILMRAEKIIKTPNIDSAFAKIVVDAAIRGISLIPKDEFHYASWCATGFKVLGLAYEVLGNEEEALLAFEKALEMNPKVGIKRKAEILRKRLS